MSIIVLGLLDQLQIFSQLYLIELLVLLKSLGLFQLWHLIFDRVWHVSLLHKLKSYGISGQIFGLISSYLSKRWLRVVLDGKSSQEYWVNAGVPQGSILGPTLFHYTLMTFLMMLYVILVSMLMILSIWSVIRHLICGNNLHWLLNLNLICETLWTGSRSSFVDFNARKTQLVPIDQSNNTDSLMQKCVGLFLRKNHFLRCWGWPSLLNWIGVLTLSLLLKLPPRKLEL